MKTEKAFFKVVVMYCITCKLRSKVWGYPSVMRSIFLSNKASLLAAETLLPIEGLDAIAAADLPCLFSLHYLFLLSNYIK